MLDNWPEITKFFTCACHTEGLVVNHYLNSEDPKTVMIDIAIWKYGDYHQPRNLKERLRWAWHILWHGEIFKDQTTMDPEEAERLGKYLIKVSQTRK